MLDTPILLITFNRPKHAQRVLESIAKQQPKRLYVFQDGVRETHPDDKTKCAAVKQIIKEMVAWPCELHTLFAEDNLGCGPGPAKAISWFFEHEEEGIILEDDCLPADSFYGYCEDLLEYYRTDIRIGIISGFNPLGLWKSNSESYHISRDGTTWGWATWRNRWAQFDYNAESWPSDNGRLLVKKHLKNNFITETWYSYFNEYCIEARRDVWDYQWSYARFCNGYCAVMPAVNQIHNIGFGEDSTHTFGEDSQLAKRQSGDLKLPLKFQKCFHIDKAYDYLAFSRFVTRRKNSLFRRVILKLFTIMYVR